MSPNQLSQFAFAVNRLSCRFGVTAEEIEGHRRFAGGQRLQQPDICLVRQILMVYGRSIGLKVKECGYLLNKTPGDVSHGCKTFRNRFDTEKGIRELWEWLEGAI